MWSADLIRMADDLQADRGACRHPAHRRRGRAFCAGAAVLPRPGGADAGRDRTADPRAPDGRRRRPARTDRAVRRCRRRPHLASMSKTPLWPTRRWTLIASAGHRLGHGAARRDAGRRVPVPYLDRVSFLTLLGTAIGVKGQGLDPTATDRLQRSRKADRRVRPPHRARRRWRHPRTHGAAAAHGRCRDRRHGIARLRCRGPCRAHALAARSWQVTQAATVVDVAAKKFTRVNNNIDEQKSCF